ncbi:DNA gyrase subunit A [Rhodohalobacter sulfatireducens]|uniref:DNA gyrase subunit A n=1 Tax=Rhodohalobacter sulfatireducens TaxID=2911366 RepID=A0ABS9K8I7_9BACT|nr:DNA gyrase subunit A [Rhodohalobacter sulfatireducens]MCG2587173.1 DNA gyrase subunit A [Rhodohalobacter sulfatireducens]MDR9364642.1 DNA gyrase subunit A [Balneolaceae bacterium]MDR9407262.1 DNA gyrase subunit A [Balneolaceae bacterium]
MASEKIIPVTIEDEMKSSYIDYSMSVIVSRALPDVRDGLKPVHRRALYGMSDLGMLHNRNYKKSARIVGEVLGKYHPHGDSAVYDSIVRMVQDFSLRYPLVDGQGNFGSIDGDSAAAMRYTEVRMQRISEELLTDINKDTVDFQDNFDDTLTEPTVLPAMLPNLLLNGASGIAVGMATNMAPHNINEVIDGTVAVLDDPEIETDDLMKHITAPDFPTGGIIYGYEGVKEAYHTGRGKITMRARANVEELRGNREQIVITEIPYQVNKSTLIEKMARLVQDEKITEISEIRDESDREGLRVVIVLKRNSNAGVVLNQLYKYTQMQQTFGVINLALVKGRPKVMPLKELIERFIEHRIEVIIRRTIYDLDQAEARAHILEGLKIALDNLDEVIKTIRAANNPQEANKELRRKFALTDIQAKAILDMRLQKLTGLEREKVDQEYRDIVDKISEFRSILSNRDQQKGIIKDELLQLQDRYGDERRTEVIYSADDFSVEDMIADEDVVVTISNKGFIKRMPVSGYRRQRRGGKGMKGTTTKDDEYVEHLFVATNHNYILFFTEKGNCYWLKVYEIPEGSRLARGRAIVNLIDIDKDDSIKTFVPVKTLEDEEYINSHSIIMATKEGQVKKTLLEAYSRPRRDGIIAINIREGDSLLEAALTDGESNIILANKKGRAIRFHEEEARDMGRNTSGVRGMNLGKNNELVDMVVIKNTHEATVLAISENGYGKRSLVDDYREQSRGGKGVITLKVTPKTGNLIALKEVSDNDDLMVITERGKVIRMQCKGIRTMGRNTQGVRIMRLDDDGKIAAITRVVNEDADETDNVG